MSIEDSSNAAAEPRPEAIPAVEETAKTKPLNMVLSLAICFVAWLVPGLGHVLLGRWVRGLLLGASVLLMFIIGIGMQGKLYGLDIEQPLHIFALFANLGVGLPYFLAQRMDLAAGDMTARTFDYGTTYLWICGLLNYLVALDAFDIAQARKP